MNAATATHLRPFDLVLVAAYLVGITLFGLRFREKKGAAKTAGAPATARSLKSYFLADNTIPWWAIALSIVSAETSTLTIISIPGVAFAGDFGFLQIVLGYMLGRIVVALLFLPRYFAGEMLTAYQLIDNRFGPTLHKVTAGLFLLTRAAAEGVRVFAVSIVVGIAIGTGDTLSIGIISLLTLLYTFEGGMTAVIWTDVVQMAIYVGGTLVAVWSLGHHIPGGWATIHQVAGAAGKFHLFNFALNLTTTYTFWAGILGGTFLTMASHGTDQLMVQRVLAARSLRESRLALLSSGVVIFVQFTLFLLIGAGLYVFYKLPSSIPSTLNAKPSLLSPDRLFPTFIVHELPIGIAGLLIAAILAAAMSNLSAALNSLSSTTVVDFYMRLRPAADARERNLVAKSSTVLWALVLFAIAAATVTVGGKGHVVEIALSIASVAYGCLLGVFLLGTLTKFATEIGATIGMVIGFSLNLVLWLVPIFFPNAGLTWVPESHNVHSIGFPHIAFTWYVLIGAIVTFAIGALASLLFRKQSKRNITTAAFLLLPLLFWLSFPQGTCFTAQAQTPVLSKPSTLNPKPSPLDFSPITTLLNDAIAAHKLPGAVVVVGHNNQIVFEQAYGNRKLAGEPGLDGKPSPAEPMTEDTIFDMASLTKCLATATAVMQFYEQGKIDSFDDAVEKYLPAFNEAHDPQRAKVTLRMLLTHTSGEAPDVDLKDPWGLAAPDRAEGLHRALTTPLKAAPGSIFTYSDINFILLGDLVETLSGQREDDYARDHIFLPLGMVETMYHPFERTCGPIQHIGSNTVSNYNPRLGRILFKCVANTWQPGNERIAPTAHDDESTSNPSANPDFDRLLRGTVHDPTTRRMGGVAGQAGVFSTAHDISLYASALLEKLLHNTGPFPLKQSTLYFMTSPEQPGHTSEQIATAQAANDQALKGTGFSPSVNGPQNQRASAPEGTATPGLAPAYPAIKNQNLRGYGWDIDTAFSKPRGAIFPIGSFGHTGFSGTSLWMDPASDTYVILFSNAIHPRGNPPISNLRGQVATAAAHALGLNNPKSVILSKAQSAQSKDPDAVGSAISAANLSASTLTGIDVLESTNFTALKGYKKLGLLTNQTGIDAKGKRTIDVLTTNHYPLTTIFTPEHGLSGTLDRENIASTTDAATGIPVISLYGKPADRHPTHEQLKDLDAVLVDLQDAGVHFWTYEAATGYFLEAAALEKSQYHHDLQLIILDRPNPVGGVAVQGPVSDPGTESYVNYMPLPVRHGLTLGELMRYANATKHLDASLTVVPMQHWQRSMTYADTGLLWVNPSPNLRSAEAALRYPALGLIEYANISVGRGSASPFSFFGAGVSTTATTATKTHLETTVTPSATPSNGYTVQLGGNGPPKTTSGQQTYTAGTRVTQQRSDLPPPWFNADRVADALNDRHIAGVTFAATQVPIADDANHYPFHGQTIPAVKLILTDPAVADTPVIGIEILAVLQRLYPGQLNLDRDKTLICSQSTLDAIKRGDDPRDIAARWQPALDAFRAATKPYLLY